VDGTDGTLPCHGVSLTGVVLASRFRSRCYEFHHHGWCDSVSRTALQGLTKYCTIMSGSGCCDTPLIGHVSPSDSCKYRHNSELGRYAMAAAMGRLWDSVFRGLFQAHGQDRRTGTESTVDDPESC